MTSSELVSILVPAYNHERYVREALSALAAQTHRPLELLIADDASTDGTRDEIRAFLAEHGDSFDRVVFEEHDVNGGTAAALNHLLAHARGRYAFLNASDDRAEPHAIAALAQILDQDRRAALAVGDSIMIDGDGRRVFWGPLRTVTAEESAAMYRTWSGYFRAVSRPGLFEPRLFGKPGTLHRANYIPNGKLFRRQAVWDVGGWRSGMLEDWDLNFRLACRYRLHYLDEVLFAYRWHDSNTVKQPERMAALFAASEAAMAGELRHPGVWLRVLPSRDFRGGLRARLGLDPVPPR